MVRKKRTSARDAAAPKAASPNKAPPPAKRYFPATMDAYLIKGMKQAGIAEDKSASECLEETAKEWLERRGIPKKLMQPRADFPLLSS